MSDSFSVDQSVVNTSANSAAISVVEPLVIAVDGGGSKTHVICADATGKIVGEGYSGPTSLSTTTIGAAGFNLKEGVRQSLERLPMVPKIGRVVMGLAGLDSKEEYDSSFQLFSQTLAEFAIGEFILINDIMIALEGGTDDPNAVALIAGTGSNCFGRNQTGQTAKAGGMDYLLTDQGSGYAIGRAVLRQAVKSFDGRGPKTSLEQFVCEHFHITSLSELKPKVYQPLLSKTEIAELTQLALRAIDQGDQVVERIFAHAVDDLVELATAVITRLQLQATPTTLVLAGSITKISIVQDSLEKRLTDAFPQLKVVVPEHPPVFGALKLALRK